MSEQPKEAPATEQSMTPEQITQADQNHAALLKYLHVEIDGGFALRLRKLAKMINEKPDAPGMGLGQWLEAAHEVSHSGTVLAHFSETAEEFRANFKPKLAGDAGVDIYVTEDVVLRHLEYMSIPSGVHIAMPFDWFAEVRARSSTSKRMIHVFPGIIDPGYTGEIKACVTNLSADPVTIKRGERVAQLIFHKRVVPNFLAVPADMLPQTERGERGFGSTNPEAQS